MNKKLESLFFKLIIYKQSIIYQEYNNNHSIFIYYLKLNRKSKQKLEKHLSKINKHYWFSNTKTSC